jgi:hypothetical protein
MSSRAFYSLFLSFFVGVFVFSLAEVSSAVISLLFIVLVALIILCIYQKSLALFLIIGALIAFALGALRITMIGEGASLLRDKIDMKVGLSGFVCDEPRKKETTQSFCFSIHETDERILVTTGRYPEYLYGDVLEIKGKLALPKNFETYEAVLNSTMFHTSPKTAFITRCSDQRSKK